MNLHSTKKRKKRKVKVIGETKQKQPFSSFFVLCSYFSPTKSKTSDENSLGWVIWHKWPPFNVVDCE